jgi:flagellar hook protein FlgE
VDANGKIIKGVLTDLKIDTSNLSPKPTGRMSETVNLNSSATQPSVAPFDPANVNSYNYTFNTPVYDSQGNAHQMNQYFVKEPVPTPGPCTPPSTAATRLTRP